MDITRRIFSISAVPVIGLLLATTGEQAAANQ